MKTIMTIIIYVILLSTCFAQEDLLPAYSNEISYKGDIAYFQGSPFTGILVDEKTNKKLGEFKNGYKNGVFTEYYSNGEKKNEYKYANGKIVDGKYFTYLENGQKEKEETYRDEKIITIGKYEDGILSEFFELSVELYTNGAKKSEGYLKNGKKNGVWAFWYEGGQKKREGNYKDGVEDGKWITFFKNGEIESEGNYKNGKEDGLWIWWYSENEKKKEALYVEGNLKTLIYENDVDPSFSIKARFKPGAYLYRSVSGVDKDTSFIMVSFNFDKNGHYKNLADNISKSLSIRFELIGNDQVIKYGKEMLDYSMDLFNPQVITIYQRGREEKIGNKTYNTSGYKCKTTIAMILKGLKNDEVLYNKIVGGESLEIFNDQNYALSLAPILMGKYFLLQLFQIFKLKVIISEILEKDGNGIAEEVGIRFNNQILLGKGFVFDVFQDDNLSTIIGEIEVYERGDNEAKCDINSGEEMITKKFNEGIKLIAISKF